MVDVIRSEWIKLRTVRSTVVLFIVIVLLSGGISALVAIFDDERPSDGIGGVLAGLNISTILFGVIGVQIIGQEYRFNTIRATFSAVPRRARVLTAKAIVLVVATAVAAALMVVLCLAVSALILAARDGGLDLGAPGVTRTLFGSVLLCVLYALVGFGVGAILRQPIAGIVVVLVYPLVVENIIAGIVLAATGADDLDESIVRYLPFIAGFNLATIDPTIDPWLGGAILGGLALLLVVFGWAIVQHRDA
jgi:ABC-2 type transport system permease protein